MDQDGDVSGSMPPDRGSFEKDQTMAARSGIEFDLPAVYDIMDRRVDRVPGRVSRVVCEVTISPGDLAAIRARYYRDADGTIRKREVVLASIAPDGDLYHLIGPANDKTKNSIP